jgi:hypothetical protein
MPERQCNGCKRQAEWGCEAEKYLSSKDDPEARPDVNGDWWAWRKPALMPLTVDGEEDWSCPRQDVRRRGREWSRMLFYWGFYKKGHLPQAGGLEDQSNKAMELFRVFDDVNAECDQAELDRVKEGEMRAAQFGPVVEERDRGRRR